jgi:hypothetical protein
MQDRFTYAAGAELPGVELGPWTDSDGVALPLNVYTCTVLLEPHAGGTNVTIDGTCTGDADGFVTITWVADDLAITPGTYNIRVTAVENATSKARHYSPNAWPLLQVTA